MEIKKDMNIAIITARGGSKRIPKKNIKAFCGKPIIAYSIQSALQSGLFEEVMVSTDSEEIADVSKDYGASVPFFRSISSSDDYATTADVLKEVLEEYRKRGKEFDNFCCLYPTAPFITCEMLESAMSMFKESAADSLIAVSSFSYPPQRAFGIKEGKLKYIYPENERKRSQDLDVEYHDCGQFYLCRVEAFETCRSLLMPYTIPFVIDEQNVQDIDNMSDWHIAELKYIYNRNREKFDEENLIYKILQNI